MRFETAKNRFVYASISNEMAGNKTAGVVKLNSFIFLFFKVKTYIFTMNTEGYFLKKHKILRGLKIDK